MSAGETRSEDLLDKLILDIEALALLYGTEAELREKLEGKVLESHDENMRKFVKALQTEGPRETGRRFAIALGELLMASLLVVGGAIALVPTVVGASTLSSFVQYFAERASGTVGSSQLSPYVSFVDFGIGVLLMLSAFFALREAALNLKKAGLAVKTGET